MDSIKVEVKKSDRQLKHLGFVRMIAINALVCVSNLYEYAKQSSGPLKSTVGTVESTVTTVVGPVYLKFKGVPDDLLVFLDEQVDEVANKFDEHAPPSAKQAAIKAQSMVHKASEVAQSFIREAQVGGPSAAFHYAGSLYMHLLLCAMARFWYLTNQITALHVLVQMAVPTVTQWLEKYNGKKVDSAARVTLSSAISLKFRWMRLPRRISKLKQREVLLVLLVQPKRVPELTRQM